jgi:hypothetical protein
MRASIGSSANISTALKKHDTTHAPLVSDAMRRSAPTGSHLAT